MIATLHRRSTQQPPIPGMTIISRDGRRIGKLKTAQDGYFRVDARFAFDYWLSTQIIESLEDGAIHLAIDKAQIGSAIVDMDCPEDDVLNLARLLDSARPQALVLAAAE